MKILATIFLALIFEASSGQSFNYSSTKQKGNSIHDFVLKDWMILKSAKGDLNLDKHNDIAFVLQHRESVSLSNDDDYQFKLIGADYNLSRSNTGETEDRNYNFLTKKVKVTTSNIINNERKIKWRHVRIRNDMD